MNAPATIYELLTGSPRPRHRRFLEAFKSLCEDSGIANQLRSSNRVQRALMQVVTRWHGFRSIGLDGAGGVALIHQALNRGSMPYLAEFDVPLALHGYDVRRHRRAYAEARRLMEQPQLRGVLMFSDWACRSFGLHYGLEVESKCRTIYPLAYEKAYCGSFEGRTYEFTFIATQFRIKSGPEAVRAFCEIRQSLSSDARFCVVTNLAQARAALGDLGGYPGVDWVESSLSEPEIANLLAQTRCLVHPSLSDSFGVVILEALASGCAVIATDFASFCEMVTRANGWALAAPTATVVGDSYITEFGDTAYHQAYLNTLSLHRFQTELATCMSEFLLDTVRARKMMQASHALYIERFSTQAWEKRMRTILQESFPELGLDFA